MKKFLLAGIAAAALFSVPALAADVPFKAAPAAMYSWTGCYGGVAGGISAAYSRFTVAATGALQDDPNPNGGVVGGTIGCNWQNAGWVWGIESDLSWTGNKRSEVDLLAGAFNIGAKSDWLNTDRVRLGLAVDRTLFYVTGGLAVRDIKAFEFNPTAGTAQTISHDRTGWTVGAGIEGALAFDPHWTIKLEWLYADYGRHLYTFTTPGFSAKNMFFDENIIRIGLNYRFGMR
jgi:outer membrane immunogenic protein